MGASGSLAEGTPQWGAQEAEAARLEWRHCSVTWGKDCKARKMMTLTVNVILFLFGRQIFSFPIWNGLASLRSQISWFLVNILYVGESTKFPNWGRGPGHGFLREENSVFYGQIDYGWCPVFRQRKKEVDKQNDRVDLALLSWDLRDFFLSRFWWKKKTKNIASTVKIKLQ